MIKFILDESLHMHRHSAWEAVKEKVEKNLPVYVDIEKPDRGDIESLRKIFHFHPVNLEDCTFFSESPKIEEHKGYIFTVVHSIVFNEEKNTYESFDLHIFLSENYIVTVRDVGMNVIDDALERIGTGGEKKRLSSEHIYYMLLDCLVDSYFPILDFWGEKIDSLEEHIFENLKDKDVISAVTAIRKGLLTLKRIIMPQRDIIYKISHTDMNFIGEDMRIYLRDVFDHTVKVFNTLEEQRDLLANLLDAHFSKSSASLNEVMNRLTIISTIFMPLTLIAGIYGMNFKYIPELEWKYGYFAIIVLMLIMGTGLFFLFKKRKWF